MTDRSPNKKNSQTKKNIAVIEGGAQNTSEKPPRPESGVEKHLSTISFKQSLLHLKVLQNLETNQITHSPKDKHPLINHQNQKNRSIFPSRKQDQK
jgi:hypothetical protein